MILTDEVYFVTLDAIDRIPSARVRKELHEAIIRYTLFAIPPDKKLHRCSQMTIAAFRLIQPLIINENNENFK